MVLQGINMNPFQTKKVPLGLKNKDITVRSIMNSKHSIKISNAKKMDPTPFMMRKTETSNLLKNNNKHKKTGALISKHVGLLFDTL